MRKGLTFEVLAGVFTVCAAALICGLLLTAHLRPHHTVQTARSTPETITLQAVASPSANPEPAPSAAPTPTPEAPATNLPNTATGGLSTPVPNHRGSPSVKPSSTSTPTPTPDLAPYIVLRVSPTSGAAPLTVTIDVSSSFDSDGTPIANYVFNFDDGKTDSPRSGVTTVTHTYTQFGSYTLTVIAIDTAGHTSEAVATITARLA